MKKNNLALDSNHFYLAQVLSFSSAPPPLPLLKNICHGFLAIA